MDDNLIKEYPSGAKVVLATIEHAEELAPNLRKYDLLECVAMGTSAVDALKFGVEHGDVTLSVLNSDGSCIAMLGTGSADNGKAYIWLLGSEEIESRSFEFAKDSKRLAQLLVQPYGVAYNYVYAEYHDSVRWLQWIGANFHDKVLVKDLPFYEFSITYNGDIV